MQVRSELRDRPEPGVPGFQNRLTVECAVNSPRKKRTLTESEGKNIVNVGKGDFKMPDDDEFERKNACIR